MHRLPVLRIWSGPSPVLTRNCLVATALLVVLSGCYSGAATPAAQVSVLKPAGNAAPTEYTAVATRPVPPADVAPMQGPTLAAMAATAPAPTTGPAPALTPALDRQEVVAVPAALPTPSIDRAQAQGDAPHAPSLKLRPSSDTGASHSDLLTGNNMPTFDGYSQIGSTVAVYDGATLLGTTTADATGYWAFTLPVWAGLDDGVHAIVAKAIDKAGRMSPASTTLQLTIDTQAPAMPVITDATVGGSGSTGSVTLSGRAERNTVVTVLEARAPLASTAVDVSGAWSVTLDNVQPGTHDYRASATDAAGVTSPANNPRSVTVAGGPAGSVASATTASASSSTSGTVVAIASGDIACDSASGGGCQQMATSDILQSVNPDIVMPLGDNQYECGSLAEYNTFYGPSWGRWLSKTHPAPGNHEYEASSTPGDRCYNAPAGAPGYFTYFGDKATPDKPGCTVGCSGYYSYDVGAWHIIVLNSICDHAGGCGLGSPQETWLKDDLAAHPTACTLAYWHYPRFSSGMSGSTFLNGLKAIWQDLYNGGVDIVLNAHDHDYERFARLDVNGNPDPTNGIREFVLGTGGRSHQPWGPIAAGSQLRDNTIYGVLELRLNPSSYSWKFLPVAGRHFTDSGSEACHTW